MDAMSRLSFKRSNCAIIRASLLLGEKLAILMLDELSSTGITASVPYVMEKRVSLIDLLGVVW